MLRDDATRLHHMLDAAELAVAFSATHGREELEGDPLAILGLVKAVEIIGEAASRVTAAFQEQHPAIPWFATVSMRNRLVHAYFDMDLDILWDTVTVDLPILIRGLQNAIHESPA